MIMSVQYYTMIVRVYNTMIMSRTVQYYDYECAVLYYVYVDLYKCDARAEAAKTLVKTNKIWKLRKDDYK